MSRTRPEGYGTPVKGSKTERRAKQAHNRISGENVQLCDIINTNGYVNDKGQKEITFGELFSIYVVVSNKLVGVLLRARKHGLVAFEGETLFQGQDEKTKVTMLKTLEEVRRIHDRRDDEDGDNDAGEFQWGKCMKTS